MALTKVSSGLMKPDNNLELEFTSQLGTTSVVGAATGYTVRTNYYDSNVTSGSGATFKFTGTTTLGKAGNVPNADGYFYDADGRQFANAETMPNACMWGALGDGATDDTVAIQTALDYPLIKTLWLLAGLYMVSAPIRIKASKVLQGVGGAGVNGGAQIHAKTGAAYWAQYRGVIETHNYWDFSGSADYAHATKIIDIEIDMENRASVNRPDYGLVFFEAGEQSLIRGVASFYTKVASIFCPGTPAVLQIEDSSGWSSDGYGLKFSNHPDPAYPATGIANGVHNSGSIRLFGFSGDNNALGLMYANGAQSIGNYGMKAELNNPCIVIEGSGTGNTRQHWEISGYRSEHGTVVTAADRIFVQINGTAKPLLNIGGGTRYNCTTVINDVSQGYVIPDIADGGAVFYDRSGTHYNLASGGYQPPQTIHGGFGYAAGNVYDQHQHGTNADTQQKLKTNFATVSYSRSVGPNDNYLWEVEGTRGQSFYINAYSGVGTATRVLQFKNAGLAIGLATSTPIGFYGEANKVTQQTVTGSRGGNVALADLLTKLANMGLIVDGTT